MNSQTLRKARKLPLHSYASHGRQFRDKTRTHQNFAGLTSGAKAEIDEILNKHEDKGGRYFEAHRLSEPICARTSERLPFTSLVEPSNVKAFAGKAQPPLRSFDSMHLQEDFDD